MPKWVRLCTVFPNNPITKSESVSWQYMTAQFILLVLFTAATGDDVIPVKHTTRTQYWPQNFDPIGM